MLIHHIHFSGEELFLEVLIGMIHGGAYSYHPVNVASIEYGGI